MALILPLISISTRLFSKCFETIPSSPTIIAITIPFILPSFFSQIQISLNLFAFTLLSAGRAKSTGWQIILFLLINTTSGLSTRYWVICLYVKVLKNFMHHFFRTDSGLCIYHLLVIVKIQFLSQFPVVPLSPPNRGWSCTPFFRVWYIRCIIYSFISMSTLSTLVINYYYYYYYSFRVFHISVSWWFFTEIWVTACLLKSLRRFSVFWPFSIMLSFGLSSLVRQLPSRPGPLVTL